MATSVYGKNSLTYRIYTNDGNSKISPATILNHEMTHATHFDDAKIQPHKPLYNRLLKVFLCYKYHNK